MVETHNTMRDRLMHSAGTTPFETMAIIVPSFFYTTATTILISLLQIRNLKIQFCIEFFTLVMPIILNFTILANYAVEVLTASFVVCIALILYPHSPTKQPEKPARYPQIRDYITNSRSTINILSVVGILAVDFLIFPRRFAKTETFGHSLMDVGVGLFVFSNGIVDGGQTTLTQSLKGCLPLVILGLGRLVVTKQTDYHVPISEYGVHWNFFITLAVTKIFVSLIFSTINVRFVWINALLLMVSHEILLDMGLKNFVLTETKRVGFVTANKEGLVSSVGYIYLYLFSAYFSYFVRLKRGCENTSKTLMKFAFCSFLSLFLSTVCEKYFGISRRLANAAYCCWILFIGIFMTGLFYIGGKVLEYRFSKIMRGRLQPPLIFQAINYNGLIFFLISNLLTGLVNILCDTLTVGPIISITIISIYMFMNCVVVYFLYFTKFKLKL